MPSRQFEHLHEQSLQRLRDRIPSDCPVVVARDPGRGFRVYTLDERDVMVGRFQVVAAWVDGYVAAWRRVRR